jgi:hypothetical protein
MIIATKQKQLQKTATLCFPQAADGNKLVSTCKIMVLISKLYNTLNIILNSFSTLH